MTYRAPAGANKSIWKMHWEAFSCFQQRMHSVSHTSIFCAVFRCWHILFWFKCILYFPSLHFSVFVRERGRQWCESGVAVEGGSRLEHHSSQLEPDICLFFYTHTFWPLKILHSKVCKFATKITSRQNNANYTVCKSTPCVWNFAFILKNSLILKVAWWR